MSAITSIFRRTRLLWVTLAIVCSAGIAQTIPDPGLVADEQGNITNQPAKVEENAPGLVATITEDAIKAFSGVVKLANDTINSIKGNKALQKYGAQLTIMLTSIVIIWSIIKNIALKQSMPQLVGDLVLPAIVASFVLGAGLQTLPGVIESTVTQVAGIFGARSSSSMEMAIAKNLINAARGVWDAEKAESGLWTLVTAPLQNFAILLLRIGVVLLIMVAAGLGVAAILVAKFQMALAIALAPLLIPWIMFKPTEFLFSGWLNFFLKAGFGLVGVFAVSAVVVNGSQGMAALITTVNSDIAGVMTFLALAAMSIIFTYLMLKGADIGEGLISGGVTGIGQLSAVSRGAAATAPGRMASAAAGAAGGAARIGAAKVAGNAMSTASGRGSEAGRHLAQKAFGNGSVARSVFESSRSPPPSAAPAATPKD